MPRKPRYRGPQMDLYGTMVRWGEKNAESGVHSALFDKPGVFRDWGPRATFLCDLWKYIGGTVPMHVSGRYVLWCLLGRPAGWPREPVCVYLTDKIPSLVSNLFVWAKNYKPAQTSVVVASTIQGTEIQIRLTGAAGNWLRVVLVFLPVSEVRNYNSRELRMYVPITNLIRNESTLDFFVEESLRIIRDWNADIEGV